LAALTTSFWQPIQSGSERAFDFVAKYGMRGVVIGGGSVKGGAVVSTLRYQQHIIAIIAV
jgi:hypothetical protein